MLIFCNLAKSDIKKRVWKHGRFSTIDFNAYIIMTSFVIKKFLALYVILILFVYAELVPRSVKIEG